MHADLYLKTITITINCSYPPKIKEISPSLSEDISSQSSNWNNGKMKIACNSVYIQTETLTFTFAQQTVIVYFYICACS